MLTAEGPVLSISPVLLFKAGAGADTVFIRLGEVCAVGAVEALLEFGAGVAAFAVEGNNRLGEGAHSLFAVKVQKISAVIMFHNFTSINLLSVQTVQSRIDLKNQASYSVL